MPRPPFASPLDLLGRGGNKRPMAWPLSRRDQPTATQAKPKQKETTGSLLRFVLGVAILAWIFRALIIQPFYIPSGSMLPTLYIGDYVAVAKWPYGYSRYSLPFGFPGFDGRVLGGVPKRGDVVVFRHPSENSDLVKRVIGVPGDTVEVRDGRLVLNGRPVPRQPLSPVQIEVTANSPCRVVPPASPVVAAVGDHSFCMFRAYLETLPGGPSYTVLDQVEHGPADDFSPVTVPAGHFFLMGDNRDDSLDSRFPGYEGGIGMVPIENLIGRPLVTFWSTDGGASYLKPWTWFTALRGSRIGNGYTGVAE
jgi:signal peptidase I